MSSGLIFVRHGETRDNVAGVAQGWSDSPLTEKGQDQVERLARRLTSMRPSSVWSSTLPRAMSTARVISDRLGLEIRPLDDLREMNCGRWEGLPFREVRINHREHYERWKADPSVACPGGESFEDVAGRMIRAVETIIDEDEAGWPVIVSHGTAIRLIMCSLVGLPIDASYRLAQYNAAINVLTRRENGYVLRTWNDASHCAHEDQT